MEELDLGSTIKGFSPGQKVFARYTLRKILGRGGMGVVWLARDEELEREVALKFLPEVVAMDKQAILELKRETRRSLELTHPHIIRIYDFVQDGRTAAISMEFVSGDTLAALKVDQPEQRFTTEQLVKWTRQLCEALEYAHAKAQVVHRDLKPANLMIDSRGDLKIADFGIAASVSDSVSRVSNQAGSSGTPVYMSPQQMMGEKPAVTDDIYSLGATLYDLLTGKPPFHSGNIIAQVQAKVPAPVSERLKEEEGAGEVPAAWDETITACLAKESDTRPKSAREVAHRLDILGSATSAPFAVAPPAKPTAKPATPTAPVVAPAVSAPKKSNAPLIAALLAAVLLIGGALGWYYGFHLPEQKRAQEEQLRAEAEQKRQTEERELAAAIKEVETHLAAAEWIKAEVALAAMQRTGAGKPVGWSGQWAAAAGKLEVSLRQKRDEARLAALRIPVTVRTNPSGAEIVLDGTARGRSPLAGLPLPLGKHSIVARLANHDESEQMIEVTEKGQSDWTFALARSTGKLVLQARPAGAEYVLYSIDESGRRLSSAASSSGVVGAEPLNIQTGRYEVLITPKTKTTGMEHRETVTIERGQTTSVAADVRTGSLKIASTPAGAEVWQNGRRVGVTPLTLENLLPQKATEVELRLAGYKPAKDSILIPNADAPQIWEASLQKIDLRLRGDFSKWRKRVAVKADIEIQSTTRSEINGQPSAPGAQPQQNISMTNEYDLETGSDGGWTKAVASIRDISGRESPYHPQTTFAFQKSGGRWRTSVVRGGFVKAGINPDLVSPSYAALWLDGTVLPSGAIVPGMNWDVPIASAATLLGSLRVANATGFIRGRVAGADPNAASPWVDLEYTFELNGEMDPSLLTSTPGVSLRTELRYSGTLEMRVEPEAGLVSQARLQSRGSQRTTAVAGGASAAFGMIAMAARAATSTVVNTAETTTTLTITATPLEGESQAGKVRYEAAPPPVAKVPVYFSRKNNALVGIAARLGADLNGAPLARLSDGTYQLVEMAPGTHQIQVVQGVGDSMGIRVNTFIEVVAGRTNYFEIGFGMTKPQIHAQAETEGAAAVSRLKPTGLMRGSSPTPAQPALAGRQEIALVEAKRQAAQAARTIDEQINDPREVEQLPVLRVGAEPQFPFEMHRAGIEGSVEVEFIVNKNGDVPQAVVVQSSNKAFEQSAVAAVMKWKFRPALKDGRPVSVRVTQTIYFNLGK